MDSGCTWKPIFWVFLLLTCFGNSNPYSRTSPDFSSLVYAQCANQTFTGATEAYHRTLSVLYQQLLTESSRSKFFKSTAGDESLGISGIFQCRGDLGSEECHHCVGDLPETLSSRCRQAVAARVQVSGCYLRYETDGFPEHELWPSEGGGRGRSDHYEYELLHKKCSSETDSSDDYKTAREAAFAAVEAQLAKGEIGFCEKEIEHVRVLAQCEGGLGACDCGQCVSAAAEIAEGKCGSSVSGDVYLDKCFLSYSYDSEGSSNSKSATAKTIALVLGGAVAFCGFIAFLKYMKSHNHKDDSSSDC